MSSPRFHVGLIALLALLFFGDLVVHPGQVLYADHSDLLALHLPSRYFLVRSWQETGALPLWCPYNFSGMPFIHDTQVSAYYPFHLPLLFLPPDWLGAAASWIVVLHVIAAGWGTYAYARSQGLEGNAALAAALGYMFAGKWLRHVLSAGHYNMIPLAWLPLVLLWLEQAIERRSLVRATWAGAAFSLFVLGAFPYVTLYAGLFVALWTLGPALELAGFLSGGLNALRGLTPPAQKARAALGRWLGFGAWTALVGVALGAVQLLPSLEFSRESTRNLGVEPSAKMLADGLQTLVTLTGPPVVGDGKTWDTEGGLGVLWLALAVLAPVLGKGRVRFQAAVGIVLLVYVLGGALAFQWLPGFRFFRLPSRILLLAAFPVSLLAGYTIQALSTPALTPETRQQCRRVVLRLGIALLILQGGHALARSFQYPLHFHLYWIVLPVTAALAYGVTLSGFQFSARAQSSVLTFLLLIDLWTLTGPLAVVRPWEEIFTPSPPVQDLAERAGGKPTRVLDRVVEPVDKPANRTPLWPAMPALMRLESVGGFNPTDLRRYKEYLQFIDGSDQPLQPPQGDFTHPVLHRFRFTNPALLDLLGVRYVLQPSVETKKEMQLSGDLRWLEVKRFLPTQAFDFDSGGIQKLPSYTLFENRNVMPRAFVVPNAAPLPDQGVLEKLESTDFKQTVLLEGIPGPSSAPGQFFPATVREYLPNRVAIDVAGAPAGFLVLADIAFPGWRCTVDGQEVTIHRADYLFRGVRLPESAREVVFTFEPASYSWGKRISGAACLAAIGLTLWTWSFAKFLNRSRAGSDGPGR